MTAIILILLILASLHGAGLYLKSHKEAFAFFFFRDEWRLMRTLDRHADEFTNLLFYDSGCLCVGHRRLKKIFVVIWVKPGEPLYLSMHTTMTNCILSNYQTRKSERIAKKIFLNMWKHYLLEQDILSEIEEKCQ